MAADRHLHAGLLALQTGLIEHSQLVTGFQAWIGDKSRTLTDHLAALGYIDSTRRCAVETLADVHVAAHGGDVKRSLAAIPSDPSAASA